MSLQGTLGKLSVSGGLSSSSAVAMRPVQTPAGSGIPMTLQGGSSAVGSNLNAGGLVLTSGLSSGSGTAQVSLQVADRGSAGAAANTLRDRVVVPCARVMATGSGTRTELFTVTVPVGGMAAVHVEWAVQLRHSNGPDLAVLAGRSMVSAANTAGTASAGTSDMALQSTITQALATIALTSSVTVAGGVVSFGLSPVFVLFAASAARVDFLVHLSGGGAIALS